MDDHHSFHLIRRCTNLFCNVQQANIWILILHSVLYWLFTIIFIYIQIENVIWILLFTLRFLINVLYYVYTWLFYLKCQPPQGLSWCDCMVVEFTNQCLLPLGMWVQIPLRRGVLNTTLYVKVFQTLCGFLRVLQFPPPTKRTAMILLKYCWKWC